jgi:hypothetical protein
MLFKVYLETTIISYLAARPSKDLITAAHQQLTHEWWQDRREDFDLFSSQLVVQESSAGDVAIAQSRLSREGSRGRFTHRNRDCSWNGLSANLEL